MQLVINRCYGSFTLSPTAVKRFSDLSSRPCFFFYLNAITGLYDSVAVNAIPLEATFYTFDIANPNEATVRALHTDHEITASPLDRANPFLIQTVTELGMAAAGNQSELKIITIPDGTDWELSDYNGYETVHEKHKVWS